MDRIHVIDSCGKVESGTSNKDWCPSWLTRIANTSGGYRSIKCRSVWWTKEIQNLSCIITTLISTCQLTRSSKNITYLAFWMLSTYLYIFQLKNVLKCYTRTGPSHPDWVVCIDVARHDNSVLQLYLHNPAQVVPLNLTHVFNMNWCGQRYLHVCSRVPSRLAYC